MKNKIQKILFWVFNLVLDSLLEYIDTEIDREVAEDAASKIKTVTRKKNKVKENDIIPTPEDLKSKFENFEKAYK